MKRVLFITLAMISLMACSGEDPVYWYDAGTSDGTAGGNIPYYPDKPADNSDNQQTPVDDGYTPEGYTLAWSDEFDSQANLYTQWNFNVGGTGWGNNELQYYCENGVYTPTGQQTAAVSDGTLKIKAYKVTPSANSDNCEYVSARMDTKEGWEHGYIEMRAKLPTIKGCWPAFWMLPTDGPYWVQDPSGWGGEIDIMEYVTNDGPRIYFSAHCHDATRAAGEDTGYVDPKTGRKHGYCQYIDIDDPGKWHCYGMEWTSEYIRGYFDGEEYFYAPNPNPGSVYQYSWPFDQKFYLKLNLAIGGDWGGQVAANFTEATYEIDWIRVYQK